MSTTNPVLSEQAAAMIAAMTAVLSGQTQQPTNLVDQNPEFAGRVKEAEAKRRELIHVAAKKLAPVVGLSDAVDPFVELYVLRQICNNLPYWYFRTRQDIEMRSRRIAAMTRTGTGVPIGMDEAQDTVRALEELNQQAYVQLDEMELVMEAARIRSFQVIDQATKDGVQVPEFMLNVEYDISDQAYEQHMQRQDAARARRRQTMQQSSDASESVIRRTAIHSSRLEALAGLSEAERDEQMDSSPADEADATEASTKSSKRKAA